jgi:hypothetical protein
MSGAKVAAVREALGIFLRSLPLGSFFNLVTFNTAGSGLWARSQPLTAATFARANEWIGLLQAGGGTAISAGLRHASALPTLAGLARHAQLPSSHLLTQPSLSPRHVILLTDGVSVR